MNEKKNLEDQYQFCLHVLQSVDEALDRVAARDIAGAWLKYPHPSSNPELDEQHRRLTSKADEILKKMVELQGRITKLK